MLKPNQSLTRTRQAAHKTDIKNKPKNYNQKEIEKILKHTEFIKIDDNYSILIKK